MEKVEIRFTSDHIKNRTNYPNVTQNHIIEMLEENISKKEIFSVEIIDEKNGMKRYCFPVMEERVNRLNNTVKYYKTGELVVIVNEKKYGQNPNVDRLEKIAKSISRVTYHRIDKLKTIGKVVITSITVASAIFIASQADNVVEKIIEKDNKDFEQESKNIASQYTEQNGVDVRTEPTFADPNGKWEGNIYHADDGKKYVYTMDDIFVELTEEDYQMYKNQNNVELEENKGKTY